MPELWDYDSMHLPKTRHPISDDHSINEDARLSRIGTLWSVVRRANDDSDLAGSAQQQLLERYGGAIRRYLLAAVKNQHVADELFQEFAVKLIKGDFKNANPELGKFRSYVKSILFRMVADHYRKSKSRKEQTLENPDIHQFKDTPSETVEDEAFLQAWRNGVLAKAWDVLNAAEDSGGAPHFTVLRIRVDHPATSTDELAELISSAIGKPVTSGNGRVMVHRAREKFAHVLIEVVADSLENPTRETVESELIEVRLMDYCRDAFADFAEISWPEKT